MRSDPEAARGSEAGPYSRERELIRDVARRFDTGDPRVHVGIGDDGAVVRTSMLTVATCDPVVEGVHFTREDSLRLVGRKVVNRNLSDLAAMGAKPSFLLVSILLPTWVTDADRSRLLVGVQAAAEAGGCSVVGGDVSTTSGPLVVTVTALGEAAKRSLRRDGLRVGDSLHVTGPLGGSRLGRHLRFTPRISEGRWLADQPHVSAAIDVSDGFLVDLSRMLEASTSAILGPSETGDASLQGDDAEFELGAAIDARAVPISSSARRVAEKSGREPLFHALVDGEDHELLFAVRGELPQEGPLTGRSRRAIGVVTATPGVHLLDGKGGSRELQITGYQHDV